MDRRQLTELHSIQHVANIPSLLRRGILSHKTAQALEHKSIAMEVIQDIRANKVVPSGGRLHDYACVYFNGRNKMMYSRSALHKELCVVRVSTDVLDLDGVVVTDRNAASGYARFYEAPAGVAALDRDLVFAEWWTHSDWIEQLRRGSITCAEVLVPDRVPPNLIRGLYVSCPETEAQVTSEPPTATVTVDAHLFFR